MVLDTSIITDSTEHVLCIHTCMAYRHSHFSIDRGSMASSSGAGSTPSVSSPE